MEWLTEHFDVILPVALVLLFLFQRMFVRDEEEGGPPGVPTDSETEREAKRIQEEIRRKIVARQQGREGPDGGQAEEVQSAPVAYEEPQQRPTAFPRRQEEHSSYRTEREDRPKPPPVRRPAPEAPPSQPAAATHDIQDQLRIQMERLEKSRRAKEEAVQRTTGRGLGAAKKITPIRARVGGNLRGQLLADLSTGESMKRAFVLKEVVDRPIGLRDRPDVFSNWS